MRHSREKVCWRRTNGLGSRSGNPHLEEPLAIQLHHGNIGATVSRFCAATWPWYRGSRMATFRSVPTGPSHRRYLPPQHHTVCGDCRYLPPQHHTVCWDCTTPRRGHEQAKWRPAAPWQRQLSLNCRHCELVLAFARLIIEPILFYVSLEKQMTKSPSPAGAIVLPADVGTSRCWIIARFYRRPLPRRTAAFVRIELGTYFRVEIEEGTVLYGGLVFSAFRSDDGICAMFKYNRLYSLIGQGCCNISESKLVAGQKCCQRELVGATE
jgi:hypothetical protein